MNASMKVRVGVIGAVLATVAGVGVALAAPALAAAGCRVAYTANTWTESPGTGGFTANITITNLGDALTGWTLRFAFLNGQTLTPPGWSATWSQSGANMTGTNLSYNGNLGTNGSTTVGFNGRWSGSNLNPTSFTLNNVACTGTVATSAPPTSVSPSASRSTTPNTSPTNRPPTVTLIPTPNSPIAPGNITFLANASDPDPGDSVARVEFVGDGAVLATDTAAPYQFTWGNIPAGNHSMFARAVDTRGAVGQSTTSSFVIIAPTSAPPTTSPPGAAPALHVSGNRIVTVSGATYRLLGINRSGGEFACIQGNGMWDGPMDQASINAMRTWKIRAVRVPLNEECWLGNGVVPAGDIPAAGTQGAAYQQAVVSYVNLLVASGITPILEMHWNYGSYTGQGAGACTQAPRNLPQNTPIAACQKPMPDAQFAPAFWTSVANTFKNNTAVILDLFNEPFPDFAANFDTTAGWNCWKNGGTCTGIPYQVAGFQSLVNTVRATGAQNIIMVGGLSFSNNIAQMLQFLPTDPTGNLVAFAHVYNFNSCVSTSCWDSQWAPVAAQIPLTISEIGENDCAHSFIDQVMNWADAHGVGYLGWTWNNWPCTSGPALITDYNGTATAFGQGLKDRLATVSN